MTKPDAPQSPPPDRGATPQSGAPAEAATGQPEHVQADTLLSQPDSDDDQGYGPVAEEVSLDQQSEQARRVGHAPATGGAGEALADTLRPASPPAAPDSPGP